jgi:putative redox protein
MQEVRLSPPIVVTHESGVRFVARAGSHEIATDQPVSKGGAGSAPTPLELMAAALGSCVALYIQQFCAVRDLPYDGLRVEARFQQESTPSRIGKFFVRVDLSSALPSEYATMIRRVARTCPVHSTLTLGAGVTVDIVSHFPALVEA